MEWLFDMAVNMVRVQGEMAGVRSSETSVSHEEDETCEPTETGDQVANQ